MTSQLIALKLARSVSNSSIQSTLKQVNIITLKPHQMYYFFNTSIDALLQGSYLKLIQLYLCRLTGLYSEQPTHNLICINTLDSDTEKIITSYILWLFGRDMDFVNA